MTEQEAINRISYLKNKADIALSTTRSNCSWAKEDVTGTIEALDMAIKALEKQIPMKPYYEGDGYWDGELVYDYAKCPICGHDFEYGINDWEADYCSDCGQKLDWSDEDD